MAAGWSLRDAGGREQRGPGRGDLGESRELEHDSDTRNVHKPATNKCRGIIRDRSPNLRGEGRAGAESCGRREAEIKWAEEGA